MEPVSVIIPCYNVAEYIEETFNSVMGQTYVPDEIVFVNDGSTDATLKVLKIIRAGRDFIKIIDIKNGGVSKARNRGIDSAVNELIFLLDGDDTINSEYIERLAKEFHHDSQAILAIGEAQFFGRTNELWKLPAFDMKKMLQRNIIYCGCMIKKSLWDTAGRFDENLKLREDWDFFIRYCALKPEGVKQLPYLGFNYRLREDGRDTQLSDHKVLQETNNYIYSKNRHLYFQYYDDPISLIKQLEKAAWKIQLIEKELNFFNKFFFNKVLGRIRKIKNERNR